MCPLFCFVGLLLPLRILLHLGDLQGLDPLVSLFLSNFLIDMLGCVIGICTGFVNHSGQICLENPYDHFASDHHRFLGVDLSCGDDP